MIKALMRTPTHFELGEMLGVLKSKKLLTFIFTALAILLSWNTVHAKVNVISITQKSAETQIRHLIEPLLDRYCQDSCKLLAIHTEVGMADSEKFSPGFDEEIKTTSDLTPSSGQVKILIDDKVGPVSRGKLVDLLQQYLDTLDYPVKIETQIVHFPMPQGSEIKIAEIKDRLYKNFQTTLNELINQFCPQLCLLADINVEVEPVNGEEAQYGSAGEFIQDGNTTVRIKGASATILMDQILSKEEQDNIIEMAKLKTNHLKNVSLTGKAMKFPQPTDPRLGFGSGALRDGIHSQNSNKSDKSENNSESNNKSETNNNKSEANNKEEKYSRIEKIDRVENGNAIQGELQKFKLYGLIFACAVLALLIFIALASFKSPNASGSSMHRILQGFSDEPNFRAAHQPSQSPTSVSGSSSGDPNTLFRRIEIDRLYNELSSIYAQQPKVAKQVFSRVLTEDGVEATSACIHLFGEGIVVEMLRDPSLQADLAELMDYYSKNPLELKEEEKFDLLRRLHSKTVVGKLTLMGNRSSSLFDFLSEMDALQISELIRTESMTVKSIILTQCDPQKRIAIYSQLEPNSRMDLLSELTRIDYLPRDFIYNVANALKRKRKENPRLNTESLPGSEVLISLLEQTSQTIQKNVLKTLELSNPESARTVKGKLVSLDTLKYLRDGQLLEVVLSLKYDELIQFLKGAPEEVRNTVLAKSPKDLVTELEEALGRMSLLSREAYHSVERKILNRIKIMANDGHINLHETNDRMFSENGMSKLPGFQQPAPTAGGKR